jgi:hypothetical protein
LENKLKGSAGTVHLYPSTDSIQKVSKCVPSMCLL